MRRPSRTLCFGVTLVIAVAVTGLVAAAPAAAQVVAQRALERLNPSAGRERERSRASVDGATSARGGRAKRRWSHGARASDPIRRTITGYNFGTDGGTLEEAADCFNENGVFELAYRERAQRLSTIVRMLEGIRQSARPADEAEDAVPPSFVYHRFTAFACDR